MAEASSPHGGSDDLTLAQKLDRLFVTIHPDDRGEFTYREVEAGVRELLSQTGESEGSISASYVCQLRKGRRTNPTLKQIQHLAAFFKVPTTYFVGTPDEVEAIDAEMALVRAMRDYGIRDLALRASSLSPQGLRAVVEVVASLEKVPGMARKRTRRRGTDADPASGDPTP